MYGSDYFQCSSKRYSEFWSSHKSRSIKMGSNNLVCKTITLLFLYKFFPELFIASLAKASSSLIRSEASKHYYN